MRGFLFTSLFLLTGCCTQSVQRQVYLRLPNGEVWVVWVRRIGVCEYYCRGPGNPWLLITNQHHVMEPYP